MDSPQRKTRPRVLVIDDEVATRNFCVHCLKTADYEVRVAGGGEEGIRRFEEDSADVVITDLRLPGIDGLEVLRQIKARAPNVPVLLITGHGDVDVAVQAMKDGAYDFVAKPFNPEHLLLVVARGLDRQRLAEEVRQLRRLALGERTILTRSPLMERLLDVADRVARGNGTVLITGETGSGKELVARRIHARSPVSAGPFVAVNCAAIPADLLESELFGHEKGAFTGATRSRRGRFREATGGSLFLDEVAELPLALQAKLLRVLQEQRVDVLGRDTPEEIDVRIIAATNQDLSELTRAGRFRQDLLYRLKVLEIHVPPLRDRPEDIELLARHFAGVFSEGRDLKVPEAVLQALRLRAWPGNVRELQNACERMVLLAPGDTLRVLDLPPADDAASPKTSINWPDLPEDGLSLVDLEKRVIERALRLKAGNVSQTAQYLRIPRHVLVYRLSKYGIKR